MPEHLVHDQRVEAAVRAAAFAVDAVADGDQVAVLCWVCGVGFFGGALEVQLRVDGAWSVQSPEEHAIGNFGGWWGVGVARWGFEGGDVGCEEGLAPGEGEVWVVFGGHDWHPSDSGFIDSCGGYGGLEVKEINKKCLGRSLWAVGARMVRKAKFVKLRQK